ncbi:unnamed protein product [Acanthoscelides obtectus]|uniref:V-type proton ATPase subunit a n=1 Tax=Acanthoscelides obtectus TaxID=200917 RepID=A0A9P0Q094_ACAOB|nr:unnamed protein product [Acanthoscelides obtectus]CAK1633340.1 V-type proton ATPase subunit a2 [Acanthoscelides obtectus]
MVLQKATPYEPKCKTSNMFAGQIGLQYLLFYIAMICVPWMLLAKPVLIMRKRKQAHAYSVTHQQMASATENGDAQQTGGGTGGHGEGHDEEPLGEIFIHQAIHTIEYVLGSVSHTASYLRCGRSHLLTLVSTISIHKLF